jgi:hypothetical protein
MENYITLLNPDLKNIRIPVELIKSDTPETENDFICQLCTNLVYDPIKCKICANVFCDFEITTWVEKDAINRSCPICRGLFQRENLSKIEKNTLNRFKIICPYGKESCTMVKYEDLKSHITECDFYPKVYECKACKFKSDYQNIQEHVLNCGEVYINCIFCQFQFQRKVLESHQMLCGLNCQDCGKNVQKIDYDNHKLNECAKIVKSYYDNLNAEKNNELANYRDAIVKKNQIIDDMVFKLEQLKDFKAKYEELKAKDGNFLLNL